jgi:hypothetical protein
VWISSTVAPKGQDEVFGKFGPGYGAGGDGSRIGPEYAFGVYMHKALDEPFLIIKTAWGGKSLNFDFRPPSAGQWTPPPGHPDRIEFEPPAPLPLPTKIDLPKGYVPGEDILPKYASGRFGNFLGLRPMRGVPIGKVGEVYPIYIVHGPEQQFAGDPFRKGDVILGINGQGLRENPVAHWREQFYGAKTSTWKISVTRWRDGKIETFDFDQAQTLPEGRAGIAKALAEQEQRKIEREKFKGHYYRLMMAHVRKVLADIPRVCPDYDPQQGYEIAGFVWFQGWNDLVDGGTYPNRDKPRGYEQYSWLLGHFIEDVRKDLNAPRMPFVIGVLGVDGVDDPPTSNRGYFQQAMAAPASYPQFKGNLAAVHTGKYWDKQLDQLATRYGKAALKRRELELGQGLKGEALNKAFDAYLATVFTPLELEILRKGKSNQGFHYLGSGKIFAGIGKGFAEAMLELHRQR